MSKDWKLVPMEPTDQMEAAAEDDYENTGSTFPKWKSAYRAMLAVAPVAAKTAGEPIYQVRDVERLAWLDVQPDYYAERLPSNRRKVYTAPPPASTDRLTDALRRLEAACDQIARLRTQEQYLSMIDGGQQDALLELDNARFEARAIIAATENQP